jgi:glutamate-5-semialdehyde dehydrogenase
LPKLAAWRGVRRPIFVIPGFGLLTALAVMLGTVFIETVAAGGLERLLIFAAHLGVYSLEDGWGIEATLQIGAKLIATAVVIIWIQHWKNETWRDLGHAGFRPVALLLGFVPIIPATIIFLSEIDNLLRAFSVSEGLEALDAVPGLGDLVGSSWQGMLLAVIVGPFVEELIFRGVILRGLLSRWKPWLAIAVSALLFALMHANPVQTPIAIVLGIVLGWVYVRTRSIGLCFLGHALNNFSAFALGALPLGIDNFDQVPDAPGSLFHPWWFDAIGLLLFGGGVWLIHRLAPAVRPWSPPPVLPTPGKTLCAPADLADPESSMSAELAQLVTSLAQRARAASLVLATAPRAKKDAALEKLADLIDASHFELLEANQRDLLSPEAGALTAASRERLTLNEQKLRHLAQSVREVIALPDPVGEVLEETTRPNGLHIRKVRVPIGVIGIIFEARPNVTVDCAILCLKSGNASILRGGKECFHTNMALAALIQSALVHAGLPRDAVQLVPTTDRAALTTLLKLDTLIHCIIPRGGESLIRYVAENSSIPVIKHYKGVCFVYVDAAADLAMAESIALNAKVSRPSVCNAAEQLLVHREIAEKFLPAVARALAAKNVQLRCDPASAVILDRANIASTAATPADYTAEFLDYIIAIRVVDSLDSAIATINRDSSNHSDAIVTASEAAARRFLAEVDSATVYWNASTRFTDGYEFGYGAEIGISTDRLHARGPMGLPELCSYKFLIEGNGQVRG